MLICLKPLPASILEFTWKLDFKIFLAPTFVIIQTENRLNDAQVHPCQRPLSSSVSILSDFPFIHHHYEVLATGIEIHNVGGESIIFDLSVSLLEYV